MSIFSLLSQKGPTGFGYSSTAEDVTAGLSLSGKTILVTGCNSGLGFETMRVLAARGAHVIGAARTLAKAQAAALKIAGKATGIECELENLDSVRRSVSTIKSQGFRLDAIIANAGIMALPKLELTRGLERQFYTNHIGHFALVTGLLDCLSPDARVVMLSSDAHKNAPQGGIDFNNLDGRNGYKPWTFYGQSKMANLLFAKELARRFEGGKRMAFALHPGVINTNLSRNMNPAVVFLLAAVRPLFLKTVPQGAATQCFCATSPAVTGLSGNYFADCNVAVPRADANDLALAKLLWTFSEGVVAAKV